MTPLIFGPAPGPVIFHGRTSLEVENPEAFDLTGRDYTVAARIKTKEGGTIIAQAPADGPWAPDAKALFVRDGKLAFDIGWVGVVESKAKVNDEKWHDVAVTWEHTTGRVTLSVDGAPAETKEVLDLELKLGIHQLKIDIDASRRGGEPLRVEVEEAPGSAGRVQVVGGK